MYRKKVLDTLQFEDHGILDNNVDAITTVELYAFVLDR